MEDLVRIWAFVGPLVVAAAAALWGEWRRRTQRAESRADADRQREAVLQDADRIREAATKDALAGRHLEFAETRARDLRSLAARFLAMSGIIIRSTTSADQKDHIVLLDAYVQVSMELTLLVPAPLAFIVEEVRKASLAVEAHPESATLTTNPRLLEVQKWRRIFIDTFRPFMDNFELVSLGLPVTTTPDPAAYEVSPEHHVSEAPGARP